MGERKDIGRLAAGVEGVASSITDRDWASSTLDKCKVIRQMLEQIEEECKRRLPGER